MSESDVRTPAVLPDREQLLATEIAEQPEALARVVAASSREAARRIAAAVSQRKPRFVLLAARGASDHAALYAKYLVEVSLGLPAGLATPSAMTAYGARPNLSDVLLLAVSQGGDSADLRETVEIARAAGATTLAVTNDEGGPGSLAEEAELHFDVLAGSEPSGVATKSYTCQLLALWTIVDAIRGGDGSPADAVPDAAEALVGRREEARALAARYQWADRFVTTGRGYSYATAREAAAKIMLASDVSAHAFSGADLLHGPLTMIGPNQPVLAIVPDGPAATAMQPVLERLGDRGAEVAVFGAAATSMGTIGFDLGSPDLTEELHPVVDIVVLQQLALELCLARGGSRDLRPHAGAGAQASRPGAP